MVYTSKSAISNIHYYIITYYIKWTDKINYLGHIINHGGDDCHSKQCGFNGLVNKFNSNVWLYSICYVMYVTSLFIVHVSTLAFKLIWF